MVTSHDTDTHQKPVDGRTRVAKLSRDFAVGHPGDIKISVLLSFIFTPDSLSRLNASTKEMPSNLIPRPTEPMGDRLHRHAMIESFWGKLQVELLNRQTWKTRTELANAIFDYIEIYHNRQQRHSAIGNLTPLEYERQAQPLRTAS